MKQAERVVRIIELLSIGRKLSVNDLVKIFENEVPKRSIQRDIQIIEYAGIPLEYKIGEKGAYIWYFPYEYLNTIPPSVQTNELMAAYILKNYLKTFKGTRIEQDLNSVVAKLEKIAPGDVYDSLVEGEEILWNQNFGDFDYAEFNKILEEAIDAALSKKWYELEYQSGGGSLKKHTVFIHKLFTYNGVIYLAVNELGRDDYITFTLQQVVNIKEADGQSAPPPFDLQKFRKNRFAVFSGEPKKIKLQVNKETVKYFVNRRWHPTQKIEQQKDGSLILEMNTPLSWELIGLILGWHTQIKVLAPQELIDRVKERLQETLKMYE